MRRSVSSVLAALTVVALVTTGAALVGASASARAHSDSSAPGERGSKIIEVDGKSYVMRGDRLTPKR